MPFRAASKHLRDILAGIELVDSFLRDSDFESYRGYLKTKSSVERQMQIIAEAAVRLGDEAATICPGPDWKGLRAMGNILRHAYHRVDDEIVWNAAKYDLPDLKSAVLRSLAGTSGGTSGPSPD